MSYLIRFKTYLDQNIVTVCTEGSKGFRFVDRYAATTTKRPTEHYTFRGFGRLRAYT